mgnify:CR=1 FL=1
MKCEGCGQRSDWIGADSRWEAVNDEPVMMKLYECDVCGHLQRVG